jgi:hypothetical protein
MVTDGILASQLIGPAASSSMGGASPQSIERFQEAYGRANGQIDGASNPQAADPMSLLNPLLSLDSGSLQLAGQAGQVASSADLKPGELMMLTMQSHQFLFQCELTSNVANRSSDGLQQLFRQQS